MTMPERPKPPVEVNGFEHWCHKYGNSELHANKNECLWWYAEDLARYRMALLREAGKMLTEARYNGSKVCSTEWNERLSALQQRIGEEDRV